MPHSDSTSSLQKFRVPLLRTIHWAAERILRQAGYRLEPRRSGELQLGLWRKSWNRHPGPRPWRPDLPAAGSSARFRTASPRRLVLVPGFGDTPLSWLCVLAVLRPIVRRNFDEIILVDFPGYSGALSGKRPFHSMDALTRSFFDAMDSLRPDTLIGHSLGGWLTALYASRRGKEPVAGEPAEGAEGQPPSPRHIVLIDPSGVFGDESDRDELLRKFQAATREADRGIEVLRPHLFGREPFWFRFLATELSRFFTLHEISQFIGSFRQEHMLEAQLTRIQARVWLIWGEKDTLVPPRSLPIWLRELNHCRPICKAVMLRSAGHSPQIERPFVLSAVLSRIIAAAARGEEPQLLNSPLTRRWWRVVTD